MRANNYAMRRLHRLEKKGQRRKARKAMIRKRELEEKRMIRNKGRRRKVNRAQEIKVIRQKNATAKKQGFLAKVANKLGFIRQKTV